MRSGRSRSPRWPGGASRRTHGAARTGPPPRGAGAHRSSKLSFLARLRAVASVPLDRRTDETHTQLTTLRSPPSPRSRSRRAAVDSSQVRPRRHGDHERGGLRRTGTGGRRGRSSRTPSACAGGHRSSRPRLLRRARRGRLPRRERIDPDDRFPGRAGECQSTSKESRVSSIPRIAGVPGCSARVRAVPARSRLRRTRSRLLAGGPGQAAARRRRRRRHLRRQRIDPEIPRFRPRWRTARRPSVISPGPVGPEGRPALRTVSRERVGAASDEERRRRNRRQRRAPALAATAPPAPLGLVALAVVAGVGIAAWLLTDVGGDQPESEGTVATARRRPPCATSSSTETFSGTLGFAGTQSLAAAVGRHDHRPRARGLHAPPRGRPLPRRPAPGRAPHRRPSRLAARSRTESRGRDVLQLEQNLEGARLRPRAIESTRIRLAPRTPSSAGRTTSGVDRERRRRARPDRLLPRTRAHRRARQPLSGRPHSRLELMQLSSTTQVVTVDLDVSRPGPRRRGRRGHGRAAGTSPA